MVGMVDDFTACDSINIHSMGVWLLMGCDFGGAKLDGNPFRDMYNNIT